MKRDSKTREREREISYTYRAEGERERERERDTHTMLIDLVSLFYGISTFVGYLMPKPFF